MYTDSGHGDTLNEISKGAYMNELEKILNGPESPKPAEVTIPIQITKPTAAANKAHCLTDQENSIAAASVGSHIYRSPATYLADNPVIKAYKQ